MLIIVNNENFLEPLLLKGLLKKQQQKNPFAYFGQTCIKLSFLLFSPL